MSDIRSIAVHRLPTSKAFTEEALTLSVVASRGVAEVIAIGWDEARELHIKLGKMLGEREEAAK